LGFIAHINLNMAKNKKQKYYGVYSKNDNFLYGAFPFTDEGDKLAKKYIKDSLSKNKGSFYIKKNP